MNRSPFFIQWWKELRAVLPVWGAAMSTLWLCSVTPLFASDLATWQMFIFMAGSALVCTVIYTREFQDRTLIWQCLQPVNRMSVLGRKFTAAAVLQSLFGVLLLFVAPADWSTPWFRIGFAGIVSLLAVTSCGFWGFWIRNSLSATVVSAMVALLLSMVVGMQLEVIADKIWADSPSYSLVRQAFVLEWWLVAMAVYALVSAGAAVVFWRRLQLTGDANPVSRLDVSVASRFLGDRSVRRLPVWLTLVRKEFGLLRYMFWITGIFLIGVVLFMMVDRTLDQMIVAARSELLPGENLPMDAGIVWWQNGLRGVATALLVIQLALVPMLCGALAFTEEAYLGNRAWQLCQPVRSIHQCLIKFATGLAVSLILGLLIPVIVALLFASMRTGSLKELGLETGAASQTVVVHFMLFCVASWCATWSRATVTTVVKAFLLASGFTIATTTFVVLVDARIADILGYKSRGFADMPDWRYGAWLMTLLAVGATLINFRSPDVPRSRWFGQGATIVVSVFVLTFLLYRIGL